MHPASCTDPDCTLTYREHLLDVNVAPSAMPTRHPRSVALTVKENAWSRDMDSYKRLRRDGIQPKGIDGAAHLEGHAESQIEVEMGQVFKGKDEQAKAREGMDMAQQILAEMPTAGREGFQTREA